MSRAYDALKKFGVTRVPPPEEGAETIPGEEIAVIRFPGLAIETQQESAKEYEQLYRNLLLLGGQNLRTVMICGPRTGEGATTMSLNLAAYVALNKNIPALLVEADLRAPSLYRYACGQSREGFCDFLMTQGRLKNYAMKTTVPNLFAITAGRVNGETTDRFGYGHVQAVVQECLSGYPFVVFDAMPPGDHLTTDLASCVDGILIVLKSATSLKVASEAKERLEKAGGKILGVVLNRYRA